MEMTFRNAAFGGFNRQDVTEYIANTAKENEERVAALEQELEQLRSAQQERDSLEEEVNDLRSRVQELEETLKGKDTELKSLHTVAEENKALSSELDQYRSQAAEYQNMKQHIAGIELDAHKRADQIVGNAEKKAKEIVDAANAKADEIQRKTGEAVQELHRQCGELNNAFEVARGHISGELRKMEVSLGQLPLAFDRMNNLLKGMKKK